MFLELQVEKLISNFYYQVAIEMNFGFTSSQLSSWQWQQD